MSETLQIPMNEETRISLEDCFVDSEHMDARKFVFDALKNACKDAKKSKRNNSTAINQRDENGQPLQDEFSLKDVDLEKYTLPSNPLWLPKNLEQQDNKPIELKLGEKTMKFLKIFGQIIGIRHEQFNIAEEKYFESQKEEMSSRLTPDQLEKWLKSQETVKKSRLDAIPSCFEEAIYTSIWPIIQNKIDFSEGKIFDDEYDEIYKKEDSPKQLNN